MPSASSCIEFWPSCRSRLWPESVDAARDVREQVSRDSDLGHLERDILPIPDDFAINLDRFFSRASQRPVFDGLGLGQGLREVGQIVGKCVQLETDSVVGELAA